MATKNQTEKTASQTDSTASAPSKPVDHSALAQVEASAFASQVAEVIATGSKIRPLALEALASAMGESAGTKGRPSIETYLPFILALCNTSVNLSVRQSLARKANAAQKAKWGNSLGSGKYFPVATESAKSSHDGGGAAKWSFRKPVQFDIAAE